MLSSSEPRRPTLLYFLLDSARLSGEQTRTSLLEDEEPRGAEISCPNRDHSRPASLLQTLERVQMSSDESGPDSQNHQADLLTRAIINGCHFKPPSFGVIVTQQSITETMT